MSRARNYFAWQARLVRKELGARVVEVGCGVGNFTGFLLDRELVVSIDMEAECLEQLNARHKRPNLHTFHCELGSSEFLTLRRFQPDTCVCINVLEHMENDFDAVSRMASILTPGGAIVLFVPAMPSLYGPIDKNLGHFRRYTRARVKALAEETGLRLKRMHFVNAIGLLGWWTNSHVLKREAQSVAQIEIFDRFIVPLLSRVESVAPPPVGQSLFAVLQTP